MKIEIINTMLASLVEDMDYYPRAAVDATHVQHIHEAILSGVTLPIIIADKKSKRIIDGFHRRRALLKFDKDCKIDVEFRSYKDDKEMLLDAIRLNANHGKNLTPYDRTRCIILAKSFGIGDDEMASALNVTVNRIEEITETRTVSVRSSGEIVALKYPTREFLKGKTLTKSQAEAMPKIGGNKATFYVNQLILLIENNMIDVTEETFMGRCCVLLDLMKKMNKVAA